MHTSGDVDSILVIVVLGFNAFFGNALPVTVTKDESSIIKEAGVTDVITTEAAQYATTSEINKKVSRPKATQLSTADSEMGDTMLYAYTISFSNDLGPPQLLQLWRPSHPDQPITAHYDVIGTESMSFHLLVQQPIYVPTETKETDNGIMTLHIRSESCIQVKAGDRIGVSFPNRILSLPIDLLPGNEDSFDQMLDCSSQPIPPRHTCSYNTLLGSQHFSASASLVHGISDQLFAECADIWESSTNIDEYKTELHQLHGDPLPQKQENIVDEHVSPSSVKQETVTEVSQSTLSFNQSSPPYMHAVQDKDDKDPPADSQNGGVLALWLGLVAAATAGVVIAVVTTRVKRNRNRRSRTRSEVSQITVPGSPIESMLPIVIGAGFQSRTQEQDIPQSKLLPTPETS